MIAIVGSRALKQHIDINRIPVDLDIIGSYEDIVAYAKCNNAITFFPFNKGKYIKMTLPDRSIVEAEIAWPNSSAEAILNYISNDPNTRQCGMPYMIPSLNVLYMLKMSHRFLKNSPHFLKTMSDILLMRKHGAVIDSSLEELYKQRQKETYNYPHPKLNQNKKNFFDGSVNYIYDHDSIHDIIRLGSKPAYQFFKPENEEVNCSKKLFLQESQMVRLSAVYEESCVLAIERSLVPFPGIKTPKQAFEMALQKVCTSITSGWFREFAWEHYYQVLEIDPECEFWDKFQEAVKNGKVPLHEKV